MTHPDETSAAAEATIVLSQEAYKAAVSGSGDVLATARLAGVMAAKKTSDLIPLHHFTAITDASIDFEPLPDRHALRIRAAVTTLAQPGAEMEALTAASIAALTVYDMVKAIDRAAKIESVQLASKSSGKNHTAPTYKSTSPKLNGPRKAETLMGEVAAPRANDANATREAFRAFMTTNRLRVTDWAKQADVPVAQIYSFLTGKSRALSPEAVTRLAKAAGVREEDMFR